MAEATRPFDLFVDDLSTWYLRRSRDRLKDGDVNAKQTLYFVLKELAKLLAPFAPFTAEDMWMKLKMESDEESVHLTEWPKEIGDVRFEILEEMQNVRNIVTLGLQARQKQGIAVRQPLAQLRITNYELAEEYFEIVKDELNVKEITVSKGDEQKVELDTDLTPELKREGDFRELLRTIQDLRKKQGLIPSDIILLTLPSSERDTIANFEDELRKTVSAQEIQFGEEIKIDKI
jgi:isoleucyl-tRNA synthetase